MQVGRYVSNQVGRLVGREHSDLSCKHGMIIIIGNDISHQEFDLSLSRTVINDGTLN